MLPGPEGPGGLLCLIVQPALTRQPPCLKLLKILTHITLYIERKKHCLPLFPFCICITILTHPAVDLKSKETVSCCLNLVGCIKIRAHHVADLKLRGTIWQLEIMAEWADISAQATVLSRPPQRELLTLIHHLGHQGTVLSKSGHTKVRLFILIQSLMLFSCFNLINTLQACVVLDMLQYKNYATFMHIRTKVSCLR